MVTIPAANRTPVLESAAVTDVAIGKIKQMITSGELAPGDKLPREADLAVRLGLSRSSLREAVKALSLMRVLDVRQGAGTYVTSLEPSMLLGAMEFLVDFHTDDSVLQFLQVRRILESAAAALASQAMTEADLDALDVHLALLSDDTSVDAMVAHDLEFHRLMVAGSGNTVLMSLLDGISGPIQRARLWRGVTELNVRQRTASEHATVVRALRSRQPDVAAAAIAVHIAGVEQWLRTGPGYGANGRPVPERPVPERPAERPVA
ncbi:GntR family transcriptional repressor for pyruvate dehydrogenase complex [Friedmanniella endophytica]|uniref:GntR family transcriptional repressor for pyruvate dehydrogenase complex n=1 Tax=Microlunatus kandeliicorticis TaxID=1759536 RepID=A0A7W3P763_9ACTN|nr:FCD domain-containing protein [Microlunatus kandeliicorticis]MBA8795645.1 GntR family transcriptional repressor for pyruvate dehydrogenase complex [Microlunatus kandeliicorticis]